MGAKAGSVLGASACSRAGGRRKSDAIDPGRIRGLEDRRRSLLNEQKELIVQAATLRDRGD